MGNRPVENRLRALRKMVTAFGRKVNISQAWVEVGMISFVLSNRGLSHV